ncbi:MAG: triose-phosphate isomerase [Thiomicrospira sp.]|uniref:triose-phosphate isomerase n=1 Tax=Thiomicrospira sp. TaxID=935 RepID=UPI0019F21691|nr:triose-phosphate isomerase [Thiomicrospira sp.]MBE0493401.1 triose-phosphate isomerase [Thiomicrospira sp.]
MRRPFVAGNWKMHGSKAMIQTLLTELVERAERLDTVDMAVCPPSVYIDYVKQTLANCSVAVGGQNMADVAEQGAFTGEITGLMLKDVGCDYVIVGHSERRTLYAETDEQVANKVSIALAEGLTPILCVGETLQERESNVTEQVVSAQMQAVLDKVGVESFTNIVVAYEPVWAIGTGMTASPQQAQDVHAFIRGLVANQNDSVAKNLIIQYGGSVKPDNAKELFSQTDIDGGLIGGASLNAADFLAICEAAGDACSK